MFIVYVSTMPACTVTTGCLDKDYNIVRPEKAHRFTQEELDSSRHGEMIEKKRYQLNGVYALDQDGKVIL